MKLEQSFTVAAPVDQVWAALIDVERVAPCLPGAEITGADEDGAYHGTFTVKLGPTTAAYNGTLRLDEVDEAAHTVVMSARGTDKRGQGGATATIRSVVAPDGDGTKVDVDTDFTITGRLARFGRGGMIEDVSRRLLGDFSSCLQQRIVAEQAPPAVPAPESAAPEGAAAAPTPPPPPAKPVNGLRLFFQVLGDRIRRLFKRSR
jgi:carbon monoxide dehydrogenase subunit G